MYEDHQIARNVGCLAPMPVVDNVAYEFYALAPKGVMLSVVPMGVKEFTPDEIEDVLAPLDAYLEHFTIRGCDLIQHSGVPLLLTIGMERHDARLKHIEDKTGIPASSSLTGVVDAAKHLGIGNVAFANRFADDLNDRLSSFFTRAGIRVEGYHGYNGPRRNHADIKRVSGAVHMENAYQLGRKALEAFPHCDGLYMGGGAASLTPVVVKLEEEFGKPVIGHQDAMAWDILKRIDYWKPIPGCGRLLTAP